MHSVNTMAAMKRKCNKCQKVFSRPDSLKRHEIYVHNSTETEKTIRSKPVVNVKEEKILIHRELVDCIIQALSDCLSNNDKFYSVFCNQ